MSNDGEATTSSKMKNQGQREQLESCCYDCLNQQQQIIKLAATNDKYQDCNNKDNTRTQSNCLRCGRLADKLIQVIKSSTRINSITYPIRIDDPNVETDKSLGKKLNKLEAKWFQEKLDREVQLEAQESNTNSDVDCGYAWIILAVIFVINASTFGTARAYGLIFDKLARDDEHSRSQAALPFTIMGAVENMGGPLTSYLLAKTNSWRTTVFLGCCLVTLAHFLAAFMDSLVGQILVMGVMCGLGLSLITLSFFQINNSYFVRYRSRAFGLGLTGAVFGTMYISPICQYALDQFDTSACYLVLAVILLPNVPLALLLKPKSNLTTTTTTEATSNDNREEEPTVSSRIEEIDRNRRKERTKLWPQIKLVIRKPIFHLIWPTQLLFCWFNFVFGMIIVDFGKDRGLDKSHVSQLIPIWALGQLVGRIFLGSLVDIKLISYELFTVICFLSIGLSTYLLNNLDSYESLEHIILPILVALLSMFISNLYILFNGLIVKHMDKELSALSIGISSFAGSFFLLPRANIIGYYRDTTGNYDSMLSMFTYTSFLASLIWLTVPIMKLISRSRLTRENIEHVKRLPSQSGCSAT